MTITAESIENFRRGVPGDSFLGVVILDKETLKPLSLHLALAQRLDGQVISDNWENRQSRFSRINGQLRAPLPGSGGHAMLVNYVSPQQATQIAAGQATGPAYGFSIIKVDNGSYTIGTLRSGFNPQYKLEEQPRPGFAINTDNEARTLCTQYIDNMLSILSQGIRPKLGRSYSSPNLLKF